MQQVLYLAAHGGFGAERAPLGGGAAVADQLMAEWSDSGRFAVEPVNPSILGGNAPSGHQIVRFNEGDYARFCRDFENAATERALQEDPARTVVLANDVSEGPDFRGLAEMGYAVATIFHVDVVDYVAKMYLGGIVTPSTLTRWFERIPFKALIPDIGRLIFEKQRDSVRYSQALIVPSDGMKRTMLACYPKTPAEKIHVLPWGTWDPEVHDADTDALRVEFAVPREAQVLLTLSRIAPEKGQNLLLEALLEWESHSSFPSHPLHLFICGDAAFMRGPRHMRKLQRLARDLRKVKVHFPGHVTGQRKRAFFRLADLYVFPSVHESYGLTLIEALRAGLPAVALDTHGARAVLRPEFGELVARDPEALRQAITRMLADPDRLKSMGRTARAFALTKPFSTTANKLGDLLLGLVPPVPNLLG